MKLWKRFRKAVVFDTNALLYSAKKGTLKSLSVSATKYTALVPWGVIKELMTSARMASEDKMVLEEYDLEKYQSWIKEVEKRGLSSKQIRAREVRVQYAELACSFTQKRIERGKWKLIGDWDDVNQYIQGMSGVEAQVNRVDAEVLACCIIAGLQYKDVILLTADRRLTRIAATFGIKAQRNL